jgi:hypothetical protein
MSTSHFREISRQAAYEKLGQQREKFALSQKKEARFDVSLLLLYCLPLAFKAAQ